MKVTTVRILFRFWRIEISADPCWNHRLYANLVGPDQPVLLSGPTLNGFSRWAARAVLREYMRHNDPGGVAYPSAITEVASRIPPVVGPGVLCMFDEREVRKVYEAAMLVAEVTT